MPTDPVCSMSVDPERAAAKHDYNGQTHYFCSQHCANKFKENPGSYAKASGTAQAAGGGAGAAETSAIDPVCGMRVEPARAAGRQQHNDHVYYFCSRRCMTKFTLEPEKFLAQHSGEPARASGGHSPAPIEADVADEIQTDATEVQKDAPAQSSGAAYVCPMDPEVRESKPGACPKCGMALEPETINLSPVGKTEYVCPMHPEIVRPEPGVVPDLWHGAGAENSVPGRRSQPGADRHDTAVLDQLGINHPARDHRHGPFPAWATTRARTYTWAAWLDRARPGNSRRALGWMAFFRAGLVLGREPQPEHVYAHCSSVLVVAYIYSVIAIVFPDIFSPSFRDEANQVAVYFEAAAVIVTLVLLGQVLELRART